MKRGLLDDSAVNVRERVDDDECSVVELRDEPSDAPYLKPRDDAEEYILLRVSPAATTLVDRHAAAEVFDERAPYLVAALGDDDDGRVLLYAVNEEVHGLRRSEVREHGVERGLDAEQEGGGREDEHV